MARGVPGTRTGYALGSPRAVALALGVGLGALPGSAFVGRIPHAKQDTIYLAWDGGGGINDLANDRSQYDDDQAVGATWTFEASPASRFDLTDQWCFEFAFTANSTTTGRYFQFDCAAGASDLSLRIAAGGVIDIIINGGLGSTSLTLPGILAGEQRFVLAWSAEPNVDTTGAADALRHHLVAWNLDTGGFDKVTFTSVLRPAQTGAMVIWAGTTAGGSPFTGRPIAVRIGRRLHSVTETFHDFVDELGAPTTQTENDDQGLPVSSSVGFAASSAFHGPAAAWACDATRRMQHRTFSALWNEQMRIETEFTQGELDTALDPWVRAVPSSDQWRLHLTFLRSYPVPPGATHLWVEIQIRSYVASGETVPLGVRMYSMNKNPSDPSGSPLVSYFTDEKVTRDDAGVGSYVLKSRVPISVNANGFTWLALAFNVDPDDESTNDNRERVRVRSVHAVPITVDQTGGLGFGGGGMGS